MKCFISGKPRVTASPAEPDEVVAWDREKKTQAPRIAKESRGFQTFLSFRVVK